MIIKCPKCDTKFKFDESRLTGGAVKVKCKKCESVFAIKPKAPAGEAAGASTSATIETPIKTTMTLPAEKPQPEVRSHENKTPLHVESASGNVEMSFDEAVNLATEGILDAPFESEFSLRKKTESGTFRKEDLQNRNFNNEGLKPRKESTFKFGSNKVVDALEDSSGTMALAAEAAITAPRPQENSQTAINEELYLDDVKKTQELPPQLYKLREIDFDEGDSDIELASDSKNTTTSFKSAVSAENDKNAVTQLQIRELKGIRQENAPKIVSYPRVFTRTVKSVILFLALLTMLLTVLVALEGDQFNIIQSLSFWNQY